MTYLPNFYLSAEKSEETIRKRFYKKDDLSRTFMVNEMEFLPIRTQVRDCNSRPSLKP